MAQVVHSNMGVCHSEANVVCVWACEMWGVGLHLSWRSIGDELTGCHFELIIDAMPSISRVFLHQWGFNAN